MSTEVESQGFFSRLAGSLFGVLFGLVLLLVGPMLLFWNEGRAVKTAAAIAEGASSAIHVDAASVAAGNDGRLVHVNGQATTGEVLKDATFGVEVPALVLIRNVEMFQWKENVESRSEKKLGGGKKTVKEYSYEKVWSEKLLDSKRYNDAGHDNPSAMPHQGTKETAKVVKVGAFQLDDTLKNMLSGARSVPYTAEFLARTAWKDSADGVAVSGGMLYLGDPAKPKVGDVRVGFESITPGPVSVLGKQTGNSLGRYATSNGYAVHDLAMGTKGMDEMFAAQESANNVLTWILRPLGLGIIFVGLMSILGPLRVMADIIPFFGEMAGCMMFVVAGAGSLACGLPTMGVAWVFYRPLLGIALLVVGALFLAVVVGAVVVAMRSRAQPA
ncbi:MAG: TMEM43 family protein [Myxococcales bacterium]|nr:TMEM43 family protein [Myxococcales bacterium]